MPSLEGYKTSGLLESRDRDELLLGILGAEHLGVDGDERFYLSLTEKLTAHADPEIAAAAQRAVSRMRG